MAPFAEFESYDGLGLAELVKKGELTPVELVDAAIERIETHNPNVNAVIYQEFDQARKAAAGDLPDGPFKGVPFLLKDLIATWGGRPMVSGSRFFQGYKPPRDSELVCRYKATGLIILGKTNTPEFGLTPFTEPEVFGPTRNPWDTTRTPGGSSGGSAAAVASGMVPLAHGNDGGGSIRIPASCCGLFGLKPTRGRLPMGPDLGEVWFGMAVEHVLTRSVRDSAAMLDATAGPDPGAPYFAPPHERPFLEESKRDPGKLKIAFTTHPMVGRIVEPDCKKAVEETAKFLSSLGHELVEDAPEIDGEAFSRAFVTMVCAEVASDIADAEALLGKKASHRDFELATWLLSLMGNNLSAKSLSRALRYLKMISRSIGSFFQKYDLLLTPTLGMVPFKIGSLRPENQLAAAEVRMMRLIARTNAAWLLNMAGGIDKIAEGIFDFIPWTPVFNVTGQPAMSVPLYWNDQNLPIGLHFVARYADEATLFRLAGQLEQAMPWFHRRPPLKASS